MKHTKAILIKFISSLILLYIILGMFYGMTFGEVFLITLVLGVVSYIIGDLFILRKSNNLIATVADFGLAYMVIRSMSDNLIDGVNLVALSLSAAIGVALFEYLFHKYVANNVYIDNRNNENNRRATMQYQTEASEELTPRIEERTTDEE